MQEFKTLTPEQIALLKKPLPSAAITKHPTKSYLSNIKAIYVVERLNDVFGIGNWNLTSEIIDNKSLGKKTSNGQFPHIVVRAYLKVPEYNFNLESYGGNDNEDLGDAYKGAVTDALTKMGSMLSIGMDVFKGLQASGTVVKQPSFD